VDSVELHVNSIGDAADRKAHREKLVRYFEKHAKDLDEDSHRRLGTNPLRILDSKNPAMQEMIEGAPRLLDAVGDAAAEHFEGLKVLLERAGVAFTVNPRLVRGLDYYNRTVFEFVSSGIGAQSTIAGGGRYDGLFEQLGGKATPACGFGMGIERSLLALQASEVTAESSLRFYVAHVGDAASTVAWTLAEDLRTRGNTVVLGSGGTFKAQLKKADANGAQFAVIIGEDEVSSGNVTLKNLRDGTQQVMSREQLIKLERT
jgi:histidyl-tRNA synthetase